MLNNTNTYYLMRISPNQERQMQRVIIKAFSRVSGQARINLHADMP